MADSEATGMITLHVKTSKAKESVQIEPTATIKELKEAISSKFNAPVGQLCLIFAGRILKDQDQLETYSLKDGLTIHLVIKSENKAQQQAASHASQNRSTSSSAATPAPSVPLSSQSQQPPAAPNPTSLFGLGGLGSLGGMDANQGSFQEIQQQLLSNPDMMRQLMENPMVQSMMSNPDLVRQLILSNPQMQQLMERNPELSHILNNPELMRQTMEMARNPALMQEMMRSQDRAMSNLESLPGGFNALQRMYTDIQEPMLSAAQEQLQQAQSNPFSALFGDQGHNAANPQRGTENTSPLPNPWAPPGQSPAPTTPQRASTTTQPQAAPTTTTSTAPTAQSAQTPSAASGIFQSPGMQSLTQQMLSNPQLMQNMMQSPYMEQMMNQMTQNPELMASMLRNNPLLQSNPQLAEEFRTRLPEVAAQMRNPEVRQAMSNPRVMQAIMQIQQGMQQLRQEAPGLLPEGSVPSGMGVPPQPPPATSVNASSSSSSVPTTTASSTPASSTPPLAGINEEQWGNLMGRMMQAMSQAQNPEVTYRAQLEQLAAMGFVDRAKNIQALAATGGDVNLAIERLLNETQTRLA